MEKLQVKIPWWYKPFIRFMPSFYQDVIPFKHGTPWRGGAELVGTFLGGRGIRWNNTYFNDSHSAYLAARWKALWLDVRTLGSQDGVNWVVQDVNKVKERY